MPYPTTDKDYVSPGLSAVVPDAHFPHMRVSDRSSHHPSYRLLRDEPYSTAENWRPAGCIVSSEIIGPFKNGGVGKKIDGPAGHPATPGCCASGLCTGGAWAPPASAPPSETQ